MVVTTDLVDNLKDIHPSYKWIVGQRMAAQALAVEYGKTETEAFHPAFLKMKRSGCKLRVEFTHTGGALRAADSKPLNWFSVAGKDKKFTEAKVRIDGDVLIVTASKVRKPKYLRFAWQEMAMPNLVNATGLPVIPFRTDK
jgi:sialate O-acetylesterase